MKEKIQGLIIVNHILAIIGIIYGPPAFFWLVLAGWLLFGKIGGEVGLHRYFAHKSFNTSPINAKILILLAMYNCIGSPISWVGIHRKHHACPDRGNDPHGNQARWKIWLTLWKPVHIEIRSIQDLLKDPWQKFFHQKYFVILGVTYLALATINPWIPVFLISIPSVLTFHSAALVNVICHWRGYRSYNTEDKSYNNLWVNLVTLGSGLHNNHHAKPSSPYNSEHWYELDLPGFLIKYLIRTDR